MNKISRTSMSQMPTPGTVVQATVVVPTYNEADNIGPLVERILAAAPGVEVVVVDDASSDGTADRIRALAAAGHPVRVIERRDERGLSTAVLRGIREARAEICVVMDADLSHPPEMVPALIRAVEQGAEVAVGSRYVPGGGIEEWPLFRRLASKMGSLFASPLTAVRDPMAGFFCLRRASLSGLELKPRGFKILLEILARGRFRNVAEVPIRFEDRGAGHSKFSAHERREYLKQVWTLYRDLNAWPHRLLKFLITGTSGLGLHLAILWLLVSRAGLTRYQGATAAFIAAMSSNYLINRIWTFRAKGSNIPKSYLLYALGAVGGLGVQLGVMRLLESMHYLPSAFVGIVAGTAVTFLISHLWVFGRR